MEENREFEDVIVDLHTHSEHSNDAVYSIDELVAQAKKNGVKIGLTKGTTLTTKKSLHCKAIIQKHSKDFGGSLEDTDVIKLCGCSRNSYYKYKREIRAQI